MLRRRAGASLAPFILIALGFTACATFKTGEKRLEAVRTVGILSAIGDQFSFVKAGLVGADEGRQSFPIDNWHLDDFIVQQVTTALNGRFQVQLVNYDRKLFANPENESPLAAVNLVRGDAVKKLVREISPQGLDAYVVITRARAKFGGGNRTVAGIGLARYATVFESTSMVYALYEVRVIDGKTLDVIQKRIAAPLEGAAGGRLAGPTQIVDETDFRAPGDPADNESLRRIVAELLTRSLAATIGQMHLTAAAP